MAYPPFIHLTDYDDEFTVSVNINHIVWVHDDEDGEFAWMCLIGEEMAMKVVENRKEIIAQIDRVTLL